MTQHICVIHGEYWTGICPQCQEATKQEPDITDKVAPNWAVKPETLEAVNQSLRVDNRALRRTTEFLRVQVAGLEMTEGDLRAKLAYAKDLHGEQVRVIAELREELEEARERTKEAG